MSTKRWVIIGCITTCFAALLTGALAGIALRDDPSLDLRYLVAALITGTLHVGAAAAFLAGLITHLDETHADCVGGLTRHADGLEHVVDTVRSLVPGRGGLRRVS